MKRILVVEDEQHLAEGLRYNLEAEGYEVALAESGEDALQLPPADLVVLDVMLPGVDGFHVAREMRRRGWYMPVLMLTARSRPEDVLQGFESGADDYLPKPFELSILLARVKGLLRRADWQRAPADVFEFDGKRIDFTQLQLETGGNRVPLTLMEANLLRYLVQREGQVVPRKALLEDVWSVHEDTDTRAIDNFIVRLRKLIEAEPARPRHLLTVRGVGYKFLR